jgi:hypothetical protein
MQHPARLYLGPRLTTNPKRGQARRGRPPAVPVQTERRVIALALAWPTCGPQWYSDQLAREGVGIAATTVWRLLRRQQLGTRRARVAVLERASAATTGLLTERTAKAVRHVEADQPGDLLSLDTFYVGKLKGVGKVWQITGCDVASSFAWTRLIVGEVTAAAVLAFLREVVRPGYRQAGWQLQRVLTDNGLPQKSRRQSFSDLTGVSDQTRRKSPGGSTIAESHADHSHTGSGPRAAGPHTASQSVVLQVEGPSIIYEVARASTAPGEGILPPGLVASGKRRYSVPVVTTAYTTLAIFAATAVYPFRRRSAFCGSGRM